MKAKILNKLKPCPFCGDEVTLFKGVIAGVNMVTCYSCNAITSFKGHENEKDTIERYNRRATK